MTNEKRDIVRRLRRQGAKLAWIGEAGAGLVESDDTVFNTAPNRVQLRAFLSAAGVHFYNGDADAAVYANASYVALHTARSGHRTIRLPHPARITELFPESRLVSERCSEFSFDSSGTATTIFHLEK